MAALVFDASPLIILSSVGLLEKCQKLGTTLLIPLSVYQEVVEQGRQQGKDDWLLVTLLVEKRIFEVVPVQGTPLNGLSGLSPADQDAFVLAKQKKALLVMDEEEGRNTASLYGIQTIGSLGIVINLVQQKHIDKKCARVVIDEMI